MTVSAVRIISVPDLYSARKELEFIGVDSYGIDKMTPKMRTRCIKLSALKCHQANIIKQEMLSVGGDAAVARGTVSCSISETDVLLIGTDKQLKLLCCKLKQQPFGLAELSVKIIEILEPKNLAHLWSTSKREISLDRPLIMGILNVTPDSFSDGNDYFDTAQAVEHALKMVENGADIIDIGGESTRPGAVKVSAEAEIKRVLPVISKLSELPAMSDCPISIDTWKHSVAKLALEAGAEIVNDISGFMLDPDMASLIAQTGAAAVLMHIRGNPVTMQQNCEYNNLIEDIIVELSNCINIADKFGIGRSKIAIDPGIGFAKSVEQNLEILRRLEEFANLGYPLLVGSSRKSFIGRILNRETDERLYGTAATVALALSRGANIIRVHDVREMRDVADMVYAINRYPRQTSE